jgi:LPS sulfotransferase NodH
VLRPEDLSAVRPERSLLIATTPRSGSWLLAEGLRSLGIAGRPEEYFWRDMEPLYRRQWGISGDDRELLDRILREGSTRNGVFSAKVHWFQFLQLLYRLRRLTPGLDELALLEHHLGPVRIVYLERLDVVRQAISWHRALRTDVWWRVDGVRDARPDGHGEFDFSGVQHLEYLLRDYNAAWRSWFSSVGLRPLDLSYERLAERYEESLRSVVLELGLPAPDVVPPVRLVRQADAETDAWVASYTAVKRRPRPVGAEITYDAGEVG